MSAYSETQIPADLRGPFGGALPGCYRYTPPGFDGSSGPRVHWWLYVPRTKLDVAQSEAAEVLEFAAKSIAELQAATAAWAGGNGARPVDVRGEVYRRVEQTIGRWSKGVTVGETFHADVAAAMALVPDAALYGVLGAIGNQQLADDLSPKS